MSSAAVRHTTTLGTWCAELRWDDVPPLVRDRLKLVLLDIIGVTLVGAQDPEQQGLVRAWRLDPGPAPVYGTGLRAAVEPAAWLNAQALVRLELDEGNKFAKGHPAAHGFPAVLALAARENSSAEDLLSALLVAYEVAARFGRATSLSAGIHPHGSWGVTGAAAGAARLLSLHASTTAAAIDAGAGMPIAGHFASALDGNRVRDMWMGASNVSGLAAARLAEAGLASNTGTAAYSLGTILGSFAAPQLTEALGERWDVELGYFKQHSACSYTHPAADALIELKASGHLPALEDIDEIRVETHALATGLDRATWTNQLSAMFSIPFVVASTLVHGRMSPQEAGADRRDDPRVQRLASIVHVEGAADLDARLPAERAMRITIRAADWNWTAERPNPVGDRDFQPFDEAGLIGLLGTWLSPGVVAEVTDLLDRLFEGTATGADLAVLAGPLGDT